MTPETTVGVLLTLGSGLTLILVAYLATKELGVLWALIFVGSMTSDVMKQASRKGFHDPIVAGLIALMGCSVLGIIVWKSKKAEVLWALLLLNVIMDDVL